MGHNATIKNSSDEWKIEIDHVSGAKKRESKRERKEKQI